MIEKTVTAEDGWKYDFGEFDKYDAEGNLYTYTIVETMIGDTPVVNGRTPAYSVEYDGFDITNTYDPELTTIALNKIWKDSETAFGTRPESIIGYIYQNGNQYAELVLDEASSWTASLTAPRYDIYNQEYTYTADEADVPGYIKQVDGFTFTNTVSEIITLDGEKIWKGDKETYRPASIHIRLMQNGEEIRAVDVTSATDWKFSFEGLERYDANGEEFVYTISEDAVAGYTSTVDGFTVTNTWMNPKTPSTGVGGDWLGMAGTAISTLVLAGTGMRLRRRKQ